MFRFFSPPTRSALAAGAFITAKLAVDALPSAANAALDKVNVEATKLTARIDLLICMFRILAFI